MRRPARGRTRQDAADEIRERRLDDVRRTIEEFLFGIAMLVAGRDADFTGCASRAVDSSVRAALAPFLSTGQALRPDFGSHGELRVDGDLLDTETPVDAYVDFEDRSLQHISGRRPVAMARRRIRVTLRLSLKPCQVVAFTVHRGDVG